MENFKDIYNEAIKYAKDKVTFSRTRLTPEDLISEAYLLVEGEVTLASLKEAIRIFFNKNKFEYLNELPKYNIHHNQLDQQCKKCMEVLPMSYFYEQKFIQYAVHLNTCNDCRKKLNLLCWKKWYNKNHETILLNKKLEYKKHRLRYLERAINNRKRNNELKNRRRKRNREKFTGASTKSGIKNIYFEKGEQTWKVVKIIKKKKVYFGSSKSLEKAKEILYNANKK